MSIKFLSENLKGRDHFGHLSTDRRIVLKITFMKLERF
jgi:hypothetical protein